MSSNSSVSEECDGSSSVDDDDFCIDEDEECSIHPLLERDIHLFKQHFPGETVTHTALDGLDEVDIKLTVDLGFIEESVLDAWGLYQDVPLTFTLIICSAFYSFDKGVLEAYQGSKGKQTVVLIQLKKIAETFSKEYFLKHKKRREETKKSTNDDCKKEESSSAEGEGYLVQLYKRIRDRLQTLNDYCPLCDKPHGATSMLKPTVCSHPLCIFLSQSMGVMCSVTEAFHAQPQMVNLLIAFTLTACSSARHKLVLQPYPNMMELETQDFVFSKNEDGLKLLRKVMKFLLIFKFSGTHSESELRQALDLLHKQCYPTLRWIISSNRSHILHIPTEKQIVTMRTKHQFLLRNSPPAEDERFKALAKKHGSCFAFHGSPLENWHSIVRQGLVVASGTALQMHGAALGNGIYVTPSLNTALAYAGGKRKPVVITKEVAQDLLTAEKIRGKNEPCLCVALCEVITGPGLRKKDREKWIVEHSQHICTRFFFVYDSVHFESFSVDSTSSEFQDIVKSILSEI